MEKYTLKSGKYSGRTLEQVALTDFSELVRLRDYALMSEEFTERAHYISWALNHFEPVVKCRSCGGIPSTLDLKIKWEERDLPIKGTNFMIRKKIYEPNRMSPSFVYCGSSSPDCAQSYRDDSSDFRDLKFNTLLNLATRTPGTRKNPAGNRIYPLWLEEELRNVLLVCAGFREDMNKTRKITKKAARDFIDNLKLTIPYFSPLEQSYQEQEEINKKEEPLKKVIPVQMTLF